MSQFIDLELEEKIFVKEKFNKCFEDIKNKINPNTIREIVENKKTFTPIILTLNEDKKTY